MYHVDMRPVDLVGIQLAPEGAVLVLREHDAPHRALSIVVGGAEAASIAFAVAGHTPSRPQTHDIMATLVDALDAHVGAAEVTELRNGAFLARLALTGPTGDIALDARPSDAIALAVRMHAPLFVSDDVLAEAGTLPPSEEEIEEIRVAVEAAIDDEVERFRDFIDHVDPTEFLGDAPDTGPVTGEG